jgi:hypothetical protein
MKSPANLPEILSVEIVRLRGLFANRAGQEMEAAKNAPFVLVEKERAQRIAVLWRRIPPHEEQMRCHTPPYGLRFRTGKGIICRVSICWNCNNIFGDADGTDVHFIFDGSRPDSRLLFEAIRAAVGDPDTFEEDD